jgi:hypothetical protein
MTFSALLLMESTTRFRSRDESFSDDSAIGGQRCCRVENAESGLSRKLEMQWNAVLVVGTKG